MVFALAVEHPLLYRLLLGVCKAKVVVVLLIWVSERDVAVRAGSDRAETRVLVEEGLGVVTHGGVKYLEREVPYRYCSLLNAEQLTDKLPEVVLALDQQVGCLFHSDVELLALVVFLALHHDEELVRDVDIPLQLKLEWHVCLVGGDPGTVQSDPCVPAFLAIEGTLVDYALVLVQRFDFDVGPAAVDCGGLTEEEGRVADAVGFCRWCQEFAMRRVVGVDVQFVADEPTVDRRELARPGELCCPQNIG